jgi:3-oxoacyl-[acyl-carrier protein] reductase
MTDAKLDGQVALVTGATRGIGRAIAQELAKGGATVIGTATTDEGAAKIAQYLAAGSHPGTGLKLDVADGAAIDAALAEIEGRFGAVGILVNNAGITRDNLLLRMKDDEWDAVMATNLKAAFRLAKGVLRGMMKARHGRIIQIGSVVGTSGNPGKPTMRRPRRRLSELRNHWRRRSAAATFRSTALPLASSIPDMTKALPDAQREKLLEKIPLGRLGSPDDIAHAVVFLASPQAGYITGATCTSTVGCTCLKSPAAGLRDSAIASGKISQFQSDTPERGGRSMENVEQRVKKIVAEQLGRKRGRDQERIVVCRGSRGRLARHRRTRDGARRGIRDRDSRRGSREDHHGPAGGGLHRIARKEVTFGAARADRPACAPRRAASPARHTAKAQAPYDVDAARPVPSATSRHFAGHHSQRSPP